VSPSVVKSYCTGGHALYSTGFRLINKGGIYLKIRFFPFLLILTILVTACNIGENPKDHLGEIHMLALDSIMAKDKELNRDMEFIAIDIHFIL
jgi:hypothetical protein